MIRLFVLFALPLCLAAACRHEEAPVESITPSIELVESTPVETVLDDPEIPNTADVWIEMIRGASHSLDIAQFYIANREGEALEAVIQEITRAAQRGVTVRVLAEKKFESVYPETLEYFEETAGIVVRILDLHDAGGGVLHAKYFIIDGHTVFVGSQNMDWRALTHINELGVRVSSTPVATAYTRMFDYDWAIAGGASPETAEKSAAGLQRTDDNTANITDTRGTHTISPVFSPRGLLPEGLAWDGEVLVGLIRSAEDSLKLQVLSYSAFEEFDAELRSAARRGVGISLLVSDWSLSPKRQEALKRMQRIENITVKISTIPEHSGGFISFARVEHCKYLLADADRAWIGTSNWSRDYFYASRNAGLLLHTPALASVLHRKYARSWDGPYTTVLNVDTTYTSRKRDDGSGS